MSWLYLSDIWYKFVIIVCIPITELQSTWTILLGRYGPVIFLVSNKSSSSLQCPSVLYHLYSVCIIYAAYQSSSPTRTAFCRSLTFSSPLLSTVSHYCTLQYVSKTCVLSYLQVCAHRLYIGNYATPQLLQRLGMLIMHGPPGNVRVLSPCVYSPSGSYWVRWFRSVDSGICISYSCLTSHFMMGLCTPLSNIIRGRLRAQLFCAPDGRPYCIA